MNEEEYLTYHTRIFSRLMMKHLGIEPSVRDLIKLRYSLLRFKRDFLPLDGYISFISEEFGLGIE